MGMFICKLRKENNMTQMELAQQLHVTDKAVSRWERGIGYPDVVLRAKCKNVANKMQKIGFKKRHFKRLLNAK